MKQLGFLSAALAVVALTAATLVAPPHRASLAQVDQCRIQCEAQYGTCYRESKGNRKLCDAQKTQCLEKCIPKKP